MNRRIALRLTGAVVAAALLAFDSAAPSLGQTLTAQQQLAFDIYKELVEINTVTATGDTGRAADAMAARLRAAGFWGDDVQVFRPTPRKGREHDDDRDEPGQNECCGRIFNVALTDAFPDKDLGLSDAIRLGWVQYGDPSNVNCCDAGAA